MLGCVRAAREESVRRRDFHHFAGSPGRLARGVACLSALGLAVPAIAQVASANWGTRVLDVPLAGG